MTYVFSLEAITTIKIVNISITPESFLGLFVIPTHHDLCLQAILDLLSITMVSFHFLEVYIDGIMLCLLFFCQSLFIHTKLLCVPIVHSFMLLDSIPLGEYATVSSSIHLLMGI